MKLAVLAALLLLSTPAWAQADHDAGRRMADQTTHIQSLNFMDGEWRGTARAQAYGS